MMNENTTYHSGQYCELWDDPPDLDQQWTDLFHLSILGLGSSAVESLSSYIARLAIEHSVKLISLLIGSIFPVLSNLLNVGSHGSVLRYPHVVRRELAKVLNGINPSTRNMTAIVSQLTGVYDLTFTSMMPFAGILAPQELLRHHHAACLKCYEAQRQLHIPCYDLLLWSLRDVNWCLEHGCPLAQNCPYCSHPLSRFAASHRPGFCSYCQCYLGCTQSSAMQTALAEDAQHYVEFCSSSLGELLSTLTTKKEYPRREVLLQGLEKTITLIANGNKRQFCRVVGLTEFGVGQLLRGNHIPRLKTLLRISYKAGVSLEHLLLDGQVETVPSERGQDGHATLKWRKSDAQALLNNLAALAVHEPPLSLEEIARRLDRHQSTLRWHAPELCKEITARHKVHVDRQRDEFRQGILFGLEEVLHSPTEPPISLMAVGRHLMMDVANLYAMFPHHCNAITTRFDEYQREQRQQDKADRSKRIRNAVQQLHQQDIYPARTLVFTLAELNSHVRSKTLNEIRKAAMRELAYNV
jgi:hypothetical protein